MNLHFRRVLQKTGLSDAAVRFAISADKLFNAALFASMIMSFIIRHIRDDFVLKMF